MCNGVAESISFLIITQMIITFKVIKLELKLKYLRVSDGQRDGKKVIYLICNGVFLINIT